MTKFTLGERVIADRSLGPDMPGIGWVFSANQIEGTIGEIDTLGYHGTPAPIYKLLLDQNVYFHRQWWVHEHWIQCPGPW